MRVTFATAPGADHNEDLVVAAPTWAFVLDGATVPPGVRTGCVHDVSWLVARLGAALVNGLSTRPGEPLPGLVAGAIERTMAAHAATCDLTDPDSPSATVTVLRERGDALDYLVLCDSPLVLVRADGEPIVVHDDRVERLPGGRPYGNALVRAHRNRPGGFWVASTAPEAAHEAITGTVERAPVTAALLVTDGISRLAEWYGVPWREVVATAATYGPHELITQVRAAEREHGPRYGKPHDDATAAWVTW
ncbi:protein phosphatase 2C domain-containing protein [Spongiactinospora rosea]|uniref:Protein phosphatase 2C domain-containing protein n=1 Tax=Spongiactinospora rosea TaxID=2248750 RepID=A0A366M8S9_9ACTN|nr:protein phosphatase 2C domain-containing protein [Spongiactinospora rosea]RBQ21949.1 protein phosphatase 2C domain-containing protein [Spongiactinospora rosea]